MNMQLGGEKKALCIKYKKWRLFNSVGVDLRGLITVV